MVTIRDVAGEAGFSVTTVSMVLNDGPASQRISASTRTHVRKVVTVRAGEQVSVKATLAGRAEAASG